MTSIRPSINFAISSVDLKLNFNHVVMIHFLPILVLLLKIAGRKAVAKS